MSSHGMLVNSLSDGSFMSVTWLVGEFKFGAFWPSVGAGWVPLAAVVVCLVSSISCLISSGVLGPNSMGMLGHVCVRITDSPQLWGLRTRHSRPMKSWLQIVHVALVWGMRCGSMVPYVRVGSTILRLCRLLVLVLVLALLG